MIAVAFLAGFFAAVVGMVLLAAGFAGDVAR